MESSRDSGRVIAQVPDAGAVVRPDTPVRLQVAIAAATVRVPALADSDETAARKLLSARGLRLGVVTVASGSGEHAKVVAQVPVAGSSVPRGSSVDVTMAFADRPRVDSLTIPDLIGTRADSAEALLASARLRAVSVDSAIGFAPGGFVLQQEPPAGTLAPRGTTVRLWVGRGRDIPWLPIAGAVVVLLGAVARSMLPPPLGTRVLPPPPPPPPPPSPGAVPPALWLEPHVVAGRHSISTQSEPVASHELQLTPHAGAATQIVNGDETFTRELP